MWIVGLDESQRIKIVGRNNNHRYADNSTLTAESEEERKGFLMAVKQESEKAGLKLDMQKTKIMAACPITSWQIEGKRWQVLFSWFLKSLWTVTADTELKDVCSLEGAMTNLDSMLKNKDITFLTKVHIVKGMIFPVVMYGCESWMIKKAEHKRIDAFQLWCWSKLLRVSWIARRSN